MITVTETAIQKIKDKITKRGKGIGIKIGVRTTGCSGLAYTLEYVDQEDNLDLFQSMPEYKIYISPKHKPYLEGMTIDYVRQGLNEGFEFNNPNESARCGCGESFTV